VFALLATRTGVAVAETNHQHDETAERSTASVTVPTDAADVRVAS
jgi:hypothetical protein